MYLTCTLLSPQSYPLCAIVQRPDGLVDIHALAEGVAKGRSLGYRRHCRLEEVHIRGCWASPADLPVEALLRASGQWQEGSGLVRVEKVRLSLSAWRVR